MRAPLRIAATRHPRLLQIDARAWTARLSASHGRRTTLGDIRPDDIDPDRRTRLRPRLADRRLDDRLGRAAACGERSESLRDQRGRAPARWLRRGHRRLAVRRRGLRASRQPRRRERTGDAPPTTRRRPASASSSTSSRTTSRSITRGSAATRNGSSMPTPSSAPPTRTALLRGPLGRPPLDRPRPRPELPAMDRHGPARLPPSRRCRGRWPRRCARSRPAATGSSARWRCSSSTTSSGRHGTVARSRRRSAEDASPFGEFWWHATSAVRDAYPTVPADRRGVLGPRIPAPAARLQLHLRHAAARAVPRRRCAVGGGAPARRRHATSVGRVRLLEERNGRGSRPG